MIEKIIWGLCRLEFRFRLGLRESERVSID